MEPLGLFPTHGLVAEYHRLAQIDGPHLPTASPLVCVSCALEARRSTVLQRDAIRENHCDDIGDS